MGMYKENMYKENMFTRNTRNGPRVKWEKHHSNGGTGITLIETQEMLERVKQTLDEIKDPSIWVEGFELHSTNTNLSSFWARHAEKHNVRNGWL